MEYKSQLKIIAPDYQQSNSRRFLWIINNFRSELIFFCVCFARFIVCRRVAEYEKEHNEAASDISGYVSNPINAYLLTKRLTSDWRVIEQVMVHDAGNGTSQIISIIPCQCISYSFNFHLFEIISSFPFDFLHCECSMFNRNFRECYDAPEFYEIPIGRRFEWSCCCADTFTGYIQSGYSEHCTWWIEWHPI